MVARQDDDETILSLRAGRVEYALLSSPVRYPGIVVIVAVVVVAVAFVAVVFTVQRCSYICTGLCTGH